MRKTYITNQQHLMNDKNGQQDKLIVTTHFWQKKKKKGTTLILNLNFSKIELTRFGNAIH